MSELGKRLIKSGARNPHAKLSKPLWSGPDGEGPNGGITFSLLSRFLVCRERFRLHALEGWRTQDGFNHRLEYGNMWHVCEEHYLADSGTWHEVLADYCADLCQKYRHSQEQIKHWYNVCKVQFSAYVPYWKRQVEESNEERKPLLQEYAFDVPYSLPSGRTVRLRGKWDSVDIVRSPKVGRPQIWLQENKTKGDINEQQIQRNLNFDLQVMTYVIALGQWAKDHDRFSNLPFAGVRYNVIRRPLSGGRHTIKQHQPTKTGKGGETAEEYYNRLKGLIESEPEYFFMRWNVLITSVDVANFARKCLDPILENLHYWYESQMGPIQKGRDYPPANYVYPYNVYNPLDEGGSTDVDEYLKTGSLVGLQRSDNLFPELQQV
jgi:hypothetical protein